MMPPSHLAAPLLFHLILEKPAIIIHADLKIFYTAQEARGFHRQSVTIYPQDSNLSEQHLCRYPKKSFLCYS
jgi:hypothetical protein